MRAKLKVLATAMALAACFGVGTVYADPMGAGTGFSGRQGDKDSRGEWESHRGKDHHDHGSAVPALAARIAALEALVAGQQTSLITTQGQVAELQAIVLSQQAALAASVICPASTPTRFTDNGDGTVCDSQTGLMWEKKTGTVDVNNLVNCAGPGNLPAGCYDDPNNVNNYWSSTRPSPDGTLYTVFLAQLNETISVNMITSTCFAGHCDWRIPTISELRGILLEPCGTNPCIDPVFGPTLGSVWSSTAEAFNPGFWGSVQLSNGLVVSLGESGVGFARAVRGGR